MISDARKQADGLVSFIGGQNSGVSPQLLRQDQSWELYNSTVRGGRWKPRPGYDLVDLVFATVEIETWWKTKKNQGDIVYNYGDGSAIQVWAVGGRFFTVDLSDNIVEEITPVLNDSTTVSFTVPAVGASVAVQVSNADLIRVGYPIKINGKIYNVTAKSGSTLTVTNVDDSPAAIIAFGAVIVYLDPNSQNSGIVYWLQAEEFLIGQDGLSKPFIFDGGSSRRAMTEVFEVPTGTVMKYGQGRIWVAIGGNRYVAGDIVYGPTGSASYDRRDAILKFTENTFLSGGGAFTAPGTITAMAFVSSIDTSTGQGPLMIFTEIAICSVNAPADREAWSSVRDPIVTISLLANGATSFYGTIPTVNGDIFYRALDGLRTFFLARREYGNWGNTPISGEIDNLINDDAEDLLKYESAIMFDNRLLFTGRSLPDRGGAYWKGIGVLDFDTISSMRDKAPPVYDGTWTGIDPVWLFSGKYGRKERAFAACLNSDGENELWEISKDHQFDNGDGRIKWTMVSRSFTFKDPLEMKRLFQLETFINKVMGRAVTTLRYRPDEYPCWFDWQDQEVCFNWRKCTPYENCATPINFRGGYKTRIGFGQPPDIDETNDGKPSRLGYSHQIEIVNEGYFEITKIRVVAEEVTEEPTPRVDLPEGCKEIDCCQTDYFLWRSSEATDAGGESE